MRDRLVAILVGLTVAVIALYGIPRAYFVADLVHDSEVRSVERSADLISRLLGERQSSTVPGAVTESALEPLIGPDEAIEYVSPGGATTLAGDIERTGADDISATRSLAGGGRLTVWRSGAVVEDRVSGALIPLVLLGVGLLVVTALVGAWLARRLSRPFIELAAVAEDIGRGRFDVEVPHYSVPEAEAIGDALRRGGAQLDMLLQRERDLAVNASHELRTPIAALRLELEDLSMWPETPPAVADELRRYIPELKRLSTAVTHYLDTARDQRRGDAGLDD